MDAHTNKRNRAALEEVYALISSRLGMPFDRMAAGVLAASDACKDECSPEVQATLWMYGGIVFGSGMNDLKSAQCAFEIAHAWDPKIGLDESLATSAVKAVFARVRHDVCAAGG